MADSLPTGPGEPARPAPPDDVSKPPSAYDPEILRALGLITVEFSRLEATAVDLYAMLTAPDPFSGDIAAAGLNVSEVFNRMIAMAEQKIQSGILLTSIRDWIRAAGQVTEERNGVVHAQWLGLAVTLRMRVKKGELRKTFTHHSAADLAGIARRAWQLHVEGGQLRFDLARAGFRSITEVSDVAVTRTPATTVFPVAVDRLSGRPSPPPVWPGDA